MAEKKVSETETEKATTSRLVIDKKNCSKP